MDRRETSKWTYSTLNPLRPSKIPTNIKYHPSIKNSTVFGQTYQRQSPIKGSKDTSRLITTSNTSSFYFSKTTTQSKINMNIKYHYSIKISQKFGQSYKYNSSITDVQECQETLTPQNTPQRRWAYLLPEKSNNLEVPLQKGIQ